MLKLPTMSWSPIKTVIAVDAVLDPVLLQYVSAKICVAFQMASLTQSRRPP